MDCLSKIFLREKSVDTTELHYSTKKRHHVLGILYIELYLKGIFLNGRVIQYAGISLWNRTRYSTMSKHHDVGLEIFHKQTNKHLM